MKAIHVFTFLLALLTATTMQAQDINGDLNHNNELDVNDITMLIDGYLTGQKTYHRTSFNPYEVQNGDIVGTWYNEANSSIEFREDGTVVGNVYPDVKTYQFMPNSSQIILFDAEGKPRYLWLVAFLSQDYLALNMMSGSELVVYTPKPNETKQAVTISISDTSLVMAPHDYRSLTASAKAADGSEVGVIWSMDRTGVVTVDGNVVIATDGGQVVVTATAADGSGLSASCTILVLEAIDLGLSIRWASMNIGAKGPEDYGDYFAWGETAPKENSTYYSWNYYDDSKYTE
ncbi:MAG: hypothetical protein IJT97_07275, partial [Bacteroidaceae bacterium]|nr:hypothetical protein [Bacteroidaceae bacterium]